MFQTLTLPVFEKTQSSTAVSSQFSMIYKKNKLDSINHLNLSFKPMQVKEEFLEWCFLSLNWQNSITQLQLNKVIIFFLHVIKHIHFSLTDKTQLMFKYMYHKQLFFSWKTVGLLMTPSSQSQHSPPKNHFLKN